MVIHIAIKANVKAQFPQNPTALSGVYSATQEITMDACYRILNRVSERET